MAYTGSNALSASDLNTRLLAGQVIGGRYRVSHLLGEGGMAAVWAGSNERTGKRIALKVIRPGFMSTPGAEAFLHSEGLAASRVNHPNVVTVFDVIEHEGMACIVMELLDGLPLGTYISRSGQLSVREATSILLPAMRGVAAAHAQGVIHRDLKPQNIFVCIDPDGRVVTTKVLDFGISLMMDWARMRAVATMPGLVGTPAYMAPEHIEGSDRIDERVDVYGFGLLLYEALTGRMPFPGTDQTEVLRRVLNDAPAPLRELRSDLPLGLVGIVETAMAKRPDKRFVSLNQMVSEIEDLMMSPALASAAGTPVAGVPSSALSYTLSGPLSMSVPTHIGREGSGAHNATVIFGQPQKRDVEEAAPQAQVSDLGTGSAAEDDWSRKLASVTTSASASPRPVSPSSLPVTPAPVSAVAFPPTVVRLRGLRVLRALLDRARDRRVLVGAAIALVILVGTFVITAGRARTAAARSARPLLTPVAAIPAPPPSPAPPAPAPAPATSTATALPLPPVPGDDSVEAPSAPVPGGQARAPRNESGTARGKRAAPRAGTLRVDDF